MAVSWTPHRFSGGVLALDTTNTVVLRGDAARRFDRFDDRGGDRALRRCGLGFRAAELGGRRACACPTPSDLRRVVLAIREATDRLFRGAASTGSLDSAATCRVACAPAPTGLDGADGRDRRAGHAVRRSGHADRLRGGAGGLGAVAAVAERAVAAHPHLRQLRLAVPRPQPQRAAASGATWRSAATARRRSGTTAPRNRRARSAMPES